MRRHALSLAAALFIASAGAAFGTVSDEDTINGKPLDDVHDIIKEMNGGESVVPKTQLMQLSIGGDRKMDGDLFYTGIDTDRSSAVKKNANVFDLSNFHADNNYMGVQAAASTRTVSGSKRRVVIGDVDFWSTGGRFRTFLAEPVKGSAPSFKISGSVRDLPLLNFDTGKNVVLTDLRGGLFIDGEQDESFVAGVVDDYSINGKHKQYMFDDFNFGTSHRSYARRTDRLYAIILDGKKLNEESFTGDPAGGNKTIIDWSSDAQFPVVRIVAGDFDGDGIASEIAVLGTPDEHKNNAEKDPYQLSIFKVSRDAKGNVTTSKLKLDSEGVGNMLFDWSRGSHRAGESACDIVAGDFDGDGRTELAVVALSQTPSHNKLKPLVQTFKYVDGGFKTNVLAFDRDDKEFDDFAGEFSDIGVYTIGILAAAGDFDGDGSDEMAFVIDQHQKILLATFAFESVKGGAPTPVLKTPLDEKGRVPGVDGVQTMRRLDCYEPLAHVVSLAAGPSYGAAGTGGFYDELYMSAFNGVNVYKYDSYGQKYLDSVKPTDLNIYRFASPLTDSRPTEIGNVQDTNVRVGLIAADLAGESLLLEQPNHFITEKARSFVTVVPVVPHHIDYIRSEWKDPKSDRTLQLVTPATSTISYSKSETESSEADTTFEMKTHFEWNVGLGADFKGPIKRVGIDTGVKGSYQRASDNVTNSTESNAVTRTTTIKSTPDDMDAAHYYTGTVHIWRYPIAGTYADDPNGLVKIFQGDEKKSDAPKNDPMREKPIDLKADKFYTIVRLAEVHYGSGELEPGDRYQPDHDERNLFSYPVSLEHDKSYEDSEMKLNTPYDHTMNTPDEYTVQFEGVGSDKNATVETKSSGGSLNFTGSLTVPNGGTMTLVPNVDAGVSRITTMSNGSSFTSTTKKSTGYALDLKKITNAYFTLSVAPYIDAGGVTNLACAVDLRPDDNDPNLSPPAAWDKNGPYGSAPDPSLILPYRAYVDTDDNDKPIAVAENEARTATKLRGVRIYDITAGEDPNVGTSYTMSTLVAGRTYKIIVPVYNASFVAPAGGTTVELGYTTSEHLESVLDDENRLPAKDDPEVRPISHSIVNLEGWAHDSDNHRGRAWFTWDTKDLTPGTYALCVRILGRDGDIHREWNGDETSPEYDPCGNDWGQYMVSVIDEKCLDVPKKDIVNYVTGEEYDRFTLEPKKSKAADVRASASSSGPKAELSFEVDGEAPMSFDEFRRWLVGRTDTVPAEIRVANRGDEAIIGAYITVRDQVEEHRSVNLVDTDLTSIFPGKSLSFHAKIDPQRFLSRNLKVEIFGSNLNETYHGSDPVPQGSGSGGCAAGAAGMAVIALLFAATRRRK